jgi:stearoyl-CoA 9-desaturase NADPH oxidoreductase
VKQFLSRLWRHFCLMLGNQPSLRRYFLPLLQWLWPGYMPDHYRARLLSKHWQTADMLYLSLRVSRRWPGFIPGQHIVLTLTHNGRYISRPFSICSKLADWQRSRHISLCCKVSSGAGFTPLLNLLQRNSHLNISTAQGDFNWQHPATAAIFVAAGSGITPIASMLLSQRHWLTPVTLLYRVRGTENAALLEQLQQLAARNSQFRLQLSDSRTEPAARFNAQVRQNAADKQCFICGPVGFMQSLKTQLSQDGVNAARIYTEQFAVAPATAVTAANNAQTVGTTFVRAGVMLQIAASAQHSLLQSAEQQGLSPTFGCRMGICLQCVCEKVSGQVRDMRSGALSGHGNEQIQLCISQPATELVIKL